MPFTPSTYNDVSSAYAQDNKKSHACDKIKADLLKATKYAWKQPVLTKKRSDADWKVTDLTKAFRKCKVEDAKKTLGIKKTKAKKKNKEVSDDIKELSDDVFNGVDGYAENSGSDDSDSSSLKMYGGLAAAALAAWYFMPQIKAALR